MTIFPRCCFWDGAEEVESPEMRLWVGLRRSNSRDEVLRWGSGGEAPEMWPWDGAEEVELPRCFFLIELKKVSCNFFW